MSELNRLQRWGLTRAKGAVIATLVIVLFIVVALQWTGSPETDVTPSRTANAKQRSAKRPSAKTQKKGALPTETVRQRKTLWPSISLEEIVQYDPFRVPERLATRTPVVEPSHLEAVPDRAENNQRAELESRRRGARLAIQKQGVSLIVSGDGGKAATIGSRRVRVGDSIDGFVIEDIREDGVILATDPNQVEQ